MPTRYVIFLGHVVTGTLNVIIAHQALREIKPVG